MQQTRIRDARRRGTVAAVREDRHTDDRIRILGGSDALRKTLLVRADEWRVRDLSETVSVQVLDSDSRFEVARPATRRVLRVRVDYHWRESRGLVEPRFRLARVTRAGVELPVERIERRCEEKGYLHGILEDAYDLVRLEDARPQRLDLSFDPLSGTRAQPFVRTVELR